MMTSSFSGKKWWNLPGLRRVNGFNVSIINRKPEFGKFDQWRLKWLAAPIRKAFGYEKHKISKVKELTALVLSLLIPLNLELKLISFYRYRWMASSKKSGSYLAKRIYKLRHKLGRICGHPKSETDLNPNWITFLVFCLSLPGWILVDYLEHRVAIAKGFVKNRKSSTRFVTLLTSTDI